MAYNTHAPSFSQTSTEEDNSSDHSGAREHHSLSNTNTNTPPPHATAGYYTIQEHNINHHSQPSKRPRGRPLGSKNKPKPPIVIRQESEDAMKPVVIEIPIGNDIIKVLTTFAQHHRVSISILSGSGSVSEITLRHHVSRASVSPTHGTCRILSLTGSYVRGHLPSLTSSNVASFHPCSSFGIIVAGPQGQVFGGVIGGRVIAATSVVVVASVFMNPQFHRLPFINENIVDEENDDNDYVDRSGGVEFVPGDNNNNNGSVMIPNMSGFGVATSTGQDPIANMNVMQWNHFNHLRYNY
ncbi:unnamed protein product [Lupinus luteus]|uniref:PPC domain-containing protein n=1 Tax=Lupinus luteus TaxID=3873 RepID=A0AAV1X391_LUPLU